MTAVKDNETDLSIKNFSFWEKLNQNEKNEMAEHTRKVVFTKGTNVYRVDERCLGVLLIKKGQLRAYTLSEDGREITLFRVFSGDVAILPAACTLTAINFDVIVDAEEDTEALLTDAVYFKRLLDSNIYVKAYAYELATSRLSGMLWSLRQILFLSADKRLALFLMGECSRQNGGDPSHPGCCGGCVLKLTHEQIARYMGSAREVVSRLLKYFSQEGLVRVTRGHVEILNCRKLKKLAE